MGLKTFASGFLQGFRAFSHSIGIAVSTIALVVTYVVGVGVVALGSRLARKQFLDLGRQQSYWVVRTDQPTIESHKRMF